MLSKKDCILAINEWEVVRKKYSSILTILDPKSVFCFNLDALNWFTEKSSNDFFHAYFGVFNNELTLIVVPLDESGVELNLPEYLTASLSRLTEEVVLEEYISKTFLKATISLESHISDISENTITYSPSIPYISISNAVTRIRSWLNQCLSWFQYECDTYNGERIFKTFEVYSASLTNCDLNTSKVYCFIGFNESNNLLIPDLIFVAVCEEPASGNQCDSSGRILSDYSKPCPPFCYNISNYNVFK